MSTISRWHRGFLAVFILAAAAAQLPSQEVETPREIGKASHRFWILLTSGSTPSGLERSEIEMMQRDHLANFKRLFELEKLSAAGPLGDPDRKLRGIVCVDAPEKEALKEYFAPDPFVEHGLLKVEAYQVSEQLGEFTRDFDLSEMEEFHFVVVRDSDKKAGDEVGDVGERMSSTHEYLNSIFAKDKLRLAMQFESNDDHLVGILIFKKQEGEKAMELVSKIPLVDTGHWSFSIMPLYMSKGILDAQSGT